MLNRLVPRLLPVVLPERRTCASCASFDLEAGQRSMTELPYFMMATRAVSPERMGQTVFTPQQPNETEEQWAARHDEARAKLEREQMGVKWEELGLCKHHSSKDSQQLRWAKDKCDSWRSGIKREIAKRLGLDD